MVSFSLFLHNPNPTKDLIPQLRNIVTTTRTITVIGNIHENPELLEQ